MTETDEGIPSEVLDERNIQPPNPLTTSLRWFRENYPYVLKASVLFTLSGGLIVTGGVLGSVMIDGLQQVHEMRGMDPVTIGLGAAIAADMAGFTGAASILAYLGVQHLR